MPLPNLTPPAFPDVPFVAGVPLVARAISSGVNPLDGGIGGLPTGLSSQLTSGPTLINVSSGPGGLIAADTDGLPFTAITQMWGVYDATNNPIAVADTIISVEFRNEMRVSTYPQELGAFASYNKVLTPYQARVRMAKGGTESDRQAFLAAIDAAFQSLDLYSVVTPEVTYSNVTLDHYDYRRERTNGANVIVVDLWLTQIRLAASPTQTTVETEEPAGAPVVNAGTVVPQTPPPTLPVPQTPAQVQAAPAPSITPGLNLITPLTPDATDFFPAFAGGA